jgi:hypothetical protein
MYAISMAIESKFTLPPNIQIYRNYKLPIARKIFERWKIYRETFDFETSLIESLQKEGKSEADILRAREERLKAIDELWKG